MKSLNENATGVERKAKNSKITVTLVFINFLHDKFRPPRKLQAVHQAILPTALQTVHHSVLQTVLQFQLIKY